MPSVMGVRRNVLHRTAPAVISSEGTVLLDISSFTGNSAAGAITFTTSTGTPNIGSGPNGTTNLCLIAALLFGQANAGTSSVTSVFYDAAGANLPMTAISGASSTSTAAGDIFLYYLMNPPQGSGKVLIINWTGLNQLSVAFSSFVNVDQTGGSTTFPSPVSTQHSGTSTLPTLSVSTTPTARKFFGAFSSTTNFTTASGTAVTGSPNNTQNTWAVSAEWDVGSSTSLTYSPNSTNWAGVGIAIKGA